MEYGYIRVSSDSQNIDRQLIDLEKNNIKKENIFIDIQSGKDFNRTNYQKLKKKLKKDDLLIIKSIDRLGRNYEMIIKEWADITKNIEANIFVIDFPMLDTRVDNNNLIGKFISDIVLQVLSFVAQNERENIKKRQAEGIKIAKEKGVKFGRPKINISRKFNNIVKNYYRNNISSSQAANILKIGKSTFLKYAKLISNEKESTIHVDSFNS